MQGGLVRWRPGRGKRGKGGEHRGLWREVIHIEIVDDKKYWLTLSCGHHATRPISRSKNPVRQIMAPVQLPPKKVRCTLCSPDESKAGT